MKFIITILLISNFLSVALAHKKDCVYNERRGLINCRDADLHSVPFEYFKNKSFHTLDLGVNSISSLSDIEKFLDLHSRDQIKIILLDHNQISQLPHNLFKTFSSLRYLDLSYNHLKRISRSFCHMTELTDLILDGNSVAAISKNAFGCLSRLKYLSLANCGLTKTPNFAKPFNLTINLSGNSIGDRVPSTFQTDPGPEHNVTTTTSSNKIDKGVIETEKTRNGKSRAVSGWANIFNIAAVSLCCVLISTIMV